MDKNNQYDDTRNMFTSWIKKVIHSAKVDYVRNMKRDLKTVALDNVPEKNLTLDVETDIEGKGNKIGQLQISFENEKLAKAFSMLSKRRREILLLLFVEEFEASEIAELLNVQVQSVHNERNRALKKLREIILNGDKDDG